MKKLSILVVLLAFGLCFSQIQHEQTSTKTYTNKADTQPEFPGGIASFRSLVMNKLNFKALSSLTGTVKSEAIFLIDSKGEISSVNATGDHEGLNKEVVRAISTISRKWKPATYKNKPVEYWYTTQVSVSLD
ncbi:energy transducer TonB [Chryseobacterium sp. Bi04]|uniref:energy transducer TonB n=1 Tax=Chryseobacterium sp. Bi04 TaxID=2822345 RepID=UPI001DA25F2A|nr:energy transducer TonB [Chryseobacterium sp. Bi04]CAH0136985.1 hypothetical protein SRABI04_00441 [Chryseobacterium sp. Bi04]